MRKIAAGARGLKAFLLALVALAALIPAAPWFYARFELAALGYDIRGVDVSHYQGEIDWEALKESGVRFAYIKATEGASMRDRRFAENWRRSREAGLVRGAYHFFSMCRPGAEQAANFIAALSDDAGSFPHAVDAEQMEPCRDGKRLADPVAEITTYLDAVEKRFGKRPLVYTTREFYDAYFRDGWPPDRLQKERFWLRSLHRAPNYGTWILWQYHNRGRRGGIGGSVDLNAFKGSAEEFEKFAAP
jgi:lysozyme